MSGSFSTVRVAASGMYVNQAALNVTSSNISNSGVTTYTRQAVNTADMTGQRTVNGAAVAQIAQVRDSWLDASYRTQTGLSGYWSYRSEAAASLDTLSGYDGETGLSAASTDFFNAWESLSVNPEDASTREAVTEAGTALAEALAEISAGLDALEAQVETDLTESVDTVNALAQEIGGLIQAVRTAEAAGTSADGLKDQLNAALDDLAQYGAVTVRQSGGTTAVYFGNELLVDNDTVRQLEVNRDADGITGIVWCNGGYPAKLGDGSLKAQLELLSDTGSGTDFSVGTAGTIQAYRDAIDAYAAGLAEAVNALHAAGTDLDGGSGIPFFTTTDGEALCAGNLCVNPILDDTDRLAAGTTGTSGDGTLALQMAALTDTVLFTTAGGESVTISGFQEALAQWTGLVSQTAEQNLTTQQAVVSQLSTERAAVASVSVDEELVRMIAYQQAYNANAQILSIISELLGTVINDMKR